jgi:Xaa-Pro aminopeptidase
MREEPSMFAERRSLFFSRLRDASAVFFAAPETIRNNDVHNDYRQDSDFYYLTGFEEPESVLVVSPQKDPGNQIVLFLRTRDPEREIWDGERVGVERAVEVLGVDKAFPIEALAEVLPGYLEGARRVYYEMGREGHGENDRGMLSAIAAARRARRQGTDTPGDMLDPAGVIHEMRLRKGPEEIESMRKAAMLTGQSHRKAMAMTRAGLREYQISAAIEFEWTMAGSVRHAYPAIVGSGPNACVLHYRAGERKMQDGELVLVDAGCEVDYYACDVTRTWPVSGRFSTEQRTIYEIVLRAQEAAIGYCRVGIPFEVIHNKATRVLVEGLVEIGLLEGEIDDIIRDESFKRFYMHRTCHWLGMDVHDVGAYYLGGTSRALEPGMVLTVEPGIYISPTDTEVPEAFRGIGVRIEDDVLITVDGPDVLTAEIPKQVADIEAIVGVEPLAN